MMNEKEVFRILDSVGAVITDSHIVYTSGKHGTAYVNKDALYPHIEETSALCRLLAVPFTKDNVDVVIGPVVGGVILSQWTALHLSRMCACYVYSVYADKDDDGGFVIKRGYDKLIKGSTVLVVEDVLTTGGSVKKVVQAVREAGGEVAGVAALCNRGAVTAGDIGGVLRFASLVNVKLDAWDESECSLCKQGIPINTDVGKGREFLARKQK